MADRFWRPASMPGVVSDMIAQWPEVFSPSFGHSFHSMPGDPTPEGCFRVANHWNIAGTFATDQTIPDNHWAIARWDGILWRVLCSFEPVKKRPKRLIMLVKEKVAA